MTQIPFELGFDPIITLEQSLKEMITPPDQPNRLSLSLSLLLSLSQLNYVALHFGLVLFFVRFFEKSS